MNSKNDDRSVRQTGFTLVEVLVVIGIIVVLAAITLPIISRISREAGRTRTSADIQSIATGLSAYKADHGDYPRVDVQNTGAAVLGKAMLGLGPATLVTAGPPAVNNVPLYSAAQSYQFGDCVTATSGLVTAGFVCINPAGVLGAPPTFSGTTPQADGNWSPFNFADGNDGAGFRLRPPVNNIAQGKVSGPYLQPDRFKTRGAVIVDADERPILYFPAGRKGPEGTQSYAGSGTGFTYNLDHNIIMMGGANAAENLLRMRAMLGDLNNDGAIAPFTAGVSFTEKGVDLPFLLWSAGPDGIFGPNATATGGSFNNAAGINITNQQTILIHQKCVADSDDITNFRP